MPESDLDVINARIVVPEIGIVPGTLIVRGGRVATIRQGEVTASGDVEVIDAQGRYVLPGLVDPHVHSGLLPPLEQRLEAESAFAASGGVTTIIRYFRRTESYRRTFAAQVELGVQRMHQDFAHHLVLFTPEQISEMEHYVRVFGVTSFKLHTNLRGEFGKAAPMDLLPEDGNAASVADVDFNYGHLYAAFETASQLPGRVRINIHAEDGDIVSRELQRVRDSSLEGLAAWHAGRPGTAEAVSIGIVSYLSRHFRVGCYFAHIGSREAVEALVESRDRGTDFGAETCPHYVALTIDSVAGPRAKVQPPIRTDEDRAWVWHGIAAGVVTALGSDHVPLTLAEKNPVSIWDARPGFGGTGLILPVFLTEGVNAGRMTIRQLAEMGSLNPARLFGLYPAKGTLQPGSDADFVIVDTDELWTVDPRALFSLSDFSVYEGRRMQGRAILTAVRGSVIYRDGKIVGRPGHGRYIRRYPRLAYQARVDEHVTTSSRRSAT